MTFIIEGCTDENACNYEPENNLDDGSCEFPPTNFDCFGNCLSDINNDGICDLFGCMNADACNYNELANIDDNNCEFSEINFDCDGNCINIDCNGLCGGTAELDDCGVCDGDNTICLGCTDLTACNYDNTALIDNGNCEFPEINFDCDGNCVINMIVQVFVVEHNI